MLKIKPQPPSAANSDTRPTYDEACEAVRTLIRYAGDDPAREGLVDTPDRVVRSYDEFFQGYNEDPAEILGRSFAQPEGYQDVVILRDIPYVAHCEHHIMPFVGKMHIAYLPKQSVVGISKLARVVEVFAKRLQIQEKMTAEIAQAIHTHMQTRGVLVVVDGVHECMTLRGVGKPGVNMVTVQALGVYADDLAAREAVMRLLRS